MSETEWGDEYGSFLGGGPTYEHPTELQALMLEQFEDSVTLKQVVEFIGERMQALEIERYAVHWYRCISTATGATLDMLGADLGLKRGGLSEEQWRALLLVRFPALFQRRSPELFLGVLRALRTGTLIVTSYAERYPATIEVTLAELDTATAAWWSSLLRGIKPYGVRLLVHVTEASATAFRFDTAGAGFDQGNAFSYTLES